MICPICQSELIKEYKSVSIKYECRNYYNLEKNYPVCHYVYTEYTSDSYNIFYKNSTVEYRYLFYPFVIYAYPDLCEANIFYLYKNNNMNHYGMQNLAVVEYFVPDIENIDSLIEKFNLYLTFL